MDTLGLMRVPLYGLSLLVLGWILHVAIWKVALPKNHNAALLAIFLGVLLLGSGVAWMIPPRLSPIRDLMEWVFFLLLYLPVMLTYISLYSLIEEQSPTLAAIECLALAGSQGVPEAEWIATMEETSRELLERRVRLLKGDGLLIADDQILRLTPKGRLFAQIFKWGAAFIGMKRGG